MKKLSILAVAFVLLLSYSCKKDKKEEDATTETATESVENTENTTENEEATSVYNEDERKVTVKLEPRSGSTVSGNAIFRQKSGVVTMVAVLGNLSEGMHAIHLHETADCSSDDATSTGGHWNPTAQPHGKWGDSKGYHKGDIGNFTADENGNGTITFVTPEWCVGCGDETRDILGKALIVHQGTDDFTSQPSGAAGGRVSCGGVVQ